MPLSIYCSVYPNTAQQKYSTMCKPKLPTIYENYNFFSFLKYEQKTLETIHEVNENYNCVRISYV
jgi:hypothetical protein